MAYDIFVSYSSKDKPVADAIVAAMESKNLRCWYAPRDIKPGAKWAESITEAITQSKIFLLIFSRNSNQSSQVLDEISYAISEEKTIIPFRIENLDPSGAMRLHLSSRHWLDAYHPTWKDHISNLVSSVALNLGIDLASIDEPVETPQKEVEKMDIPPQPEEIVKDAVSVKAPVQTQARIPQPTAEPVKKPPWLWIGITGTLVVALIFVLGVIFGPQLMGGKTQTTGDKPDQTPTEQEIAQVEKITEPSSTSSPEDVPMELPEPAQTTEPEAASETMADPIVAYAMRTSPNFHEDFSTPQDYWKAQEVLENVNLADIVSNEAIQLNDEDNEYTINFEEMQGESILLQFDFVSHNQGDENWISIVRNVEGPGDTKIFTFQLGQEPIWQYHIPGVGTIEENNYVLNENENNTVLYYCFANSSTVYLNGGLLINYDEPAFCGSDIQFWVFPGQLEIDNIKFWNLDGVSLSGEISHPLAVLVNKINNIKPTLEEDFSVQKADWFGEIFINESEPMPLDGFVKDGYLLLDEPERNVDSESGAGNVISLRLSDFPGKNIVLQFDFIPHRLEDELSIQINKRDEANQQGRWIHLYLGEGNQWTLVQEPGFEENLLDRGELTVEIYESGVNTLQFVNQNEQSAVFLNGELVFSSGEGVFTGEQTGITILSGGALRFDLDNLKFWNLDEITLFEVEESPFAPVFNYAAVTSPSFQENFSAPQFYWNSTEISNDGTNSNNLGEYVSDGVLRLDTSTDEATMLAYHLHLEAIRGEDIILMFDFIPHQFKEASGVEIHKGDEISGSNIFNLALGNETIWQVVPEDDVGADNTLNAEGQGNPRLNEVNTLLLVVYQGQSGIFLNGELLGTFESPVFSGDNINFGVLSPGSIKIDIDNIRFWTLDGVEINP